MSCNLYDQKHIDQEPLAISMLLCDITKVTNDGTNEGQINMLSTNGKDNKRKFLCCFTLPLQSLKPSI